jgi:RNAse (barnase) inhibitor barstar
MRIIKLDAREWEMPMDFLRALKAAIGGPQEHGWNADAILDVMVWGGMGGIESALCDPSH